MAKLHADGTTSKDSLDGWRHNTPLHQFQVGSVRLRLECLNRFSPVFLKCLDG